ncbi:GNAT family N-acetyltransferase [Chryseobacterium paridis]|uniref:GNAT family N-acetyltransferase n=1 Tax=Chryseobacterium paridis TaxID=2800328 RepID=A0ABS1FWV5_9FLAO|nr:GNAT family N-acetyltransferase [Chryseobacterium paridis]MBK1896918.1 GNAT family N-acetyltransferase [Chryseobacterium paridis]
MKNKASIDVIEKWLKGWSLSRELPLPVPYKSGFTVDVNAPTQKKRYLFCEPNEDFIQLSESINEPLVFLKVSSAFETFKDKIPSRWEVQGDQYMMSCFHTMHFLDRELPEDYQLEYEQYNSTYVVNIVTKEMGEQAAIGRVAIVDDLAVYDQIITDPNHRRKGLGSFVMKELEKIALSKGAYNNFLVATPEGKSLYESLGWEVYCAYTSIVIPTREFQNE